MLRNITLGQYYSADSIVHRLDPRVKIRFLLAYILLLLPDRNIFLFSMMSVIIALIICLSKVKLSYIIKGTSGLVVFVLFCSCINLFTTPGAVSYGLGITLNGIIKTGYVFWRMLLIIAGTSMLMYTTTPSELTDGLEKCFFLSGQTAMVITIALRFLSITAEELDKILKAQEARGVDFKTGGVRTRLKKLENVIVPLFQNAARRAGALSEAMDARCFVGSKERHKLNPLRYGKNDFVAYIILSGIIVGALFLIIKF